MQEIDAYRDTSVLVPETIGTSLPFSDCHGPAMSR